MGVSKNGFITARAIDELKGVAFWVCYGEVGDGLILLV